MATPILNIVPSYSVNDGVTLTFDSNLENNLIYGSKVEIRNQNGVVVATHTYTPSTYNEASSIHVLPSKQALINESTTPSMWSASTTYQPDDVVGYNNNTYLCIKTVVGNLPSEDSTSWVKVSNYVMPLSTISADFNTQYINEVQLQYTICTFIGVDASGVEPTLIGLSNQSNIRSTWIMPNPTITFRNATSPINTTSYTISIEYNTNQLSSAERVHNPIEFIVWDLYKVDNGVETLISSSGEVYSSGAQINPTSYQVNYTFNQLSNGSTYIIKCNATSILNMQVSAETPNILVDAVTYQVSSFSVENEPCDGRVKITSNIVDISGESNVTPSGGEINLTQQGDYCTWDKGLGFTNNWTTRLWAYDLRVADAIMPEQAIIHYISSTTNGVIDGYMVEDPNGYRFDLYVYPSGYGGVVNYFQSNVVNTLGTQSNPLCILIGFDYDVSGTYSVHISTT